MAKLKESKKRRLLLEEFIHSAKLYEFDTADDMGSFSRGIDLHYYQENSIKNALGILGYWYCLNESRQWQNRDRLLTFYKEYDSSLKKKDVARASFWMATGSGKTIIMIKLMALMMEAMKTFSLPKKPILLLAPNDKILNQFKENIAKYNNYNSTQLYYKDLKNYENKGSVVIDVDYIYLARSDLLDTYENVGKDKKAKRLNYADYFNEKGWYIFLDEAHRGENANSKRKSYFHELARGKAREEEFSQGFVFNFSATFEDEIDFITCAYNYNLQKFNQDGYGKNIAVFNENLDYKSENNEDDRQRTILESFIVFNAIKKSKENLISLEEKLSFKYHNPLIIAVSDKVNTQDAGIKLYFKSILAILQNKVDIEQIALELHDKLKGQNLYFSIDELSDKFLNFIKNTNNDELRKNIFYASENAKLECYAIKGNDKELAFCSKNSNKVFMLLNISKAKDWQKEFLLELGVESIKDVAKGYFDDINDENSSINIMLGSKVFSEGWDSNRVNIISFINIGSINAKKYVLQTIGRGVRIEPFLNQRKRLKHLKDKVKFNELCIPYSDALETLFIMASNNGAINDIVRGLSSEFLGNKALRGFKRTNTLNPLPIPKYKNQEHTHNIYRISKKEGEDLQNFIAGYDEDVMLLKQCLYRGFNYATLQEIKNYHLGLESKIEYSGANEDKFSEKNTIKTINSVLNSKLREIDNFEDLKDEIKHYQNMQTSLDEECVVEISKIIKNIINAKGEKELKQDYEKGKISLDELIHQAKHGNEVVFQNYTLSTKLKQHYYNPLIIYNKDDRKSKINFAIANKSERKFLQDLEENLSDNNFLQDYEWCFSRLVENQDEIFIPYFDEREQRERNFYPDFIFWLKNKKSEEFKIIFIDPKGLSHEENAKFKANAFLNVFSKHPLHYKNKKIEVRLFYYNEKAQSDKLLKLFVKSNIKDIFTEK